MLDKVRLPLRRCPQGARVRQCWLSLLAVVAFAGGAQAAVDPEARVQISRQQSQLAALQNRMDTIDAWRASLQDQNALLKNRYDGLHEVQQQLNAQFLTLREQHKGIAGEWNAFRDGQEQLAREFATVVAQVQDLAQTQQASEIRLAQIEGQAGGRGMVQLMNQVDALNLELNKLRGQVEVLANSIDNAQKRQRDMYLDLDTRLRRVEQQDLAAGAKKNEQTIAALEERIKKLEQALAARTAIPAPVNTASGAEAPAPAPSVTAAGAPALSPATLPGGDAGGPQRAYDAALSAYRVADYQGAISAFRSFVQQHPRHALAANAQYWIGDAFYQVRDYRAAIDAQRQLIASHPDSPKVPDALLNIGSAELGLGNAAAARKAWEEVAARYPDSESAEKARQRLARLP